MRGERGGCIPLPLALSARTSCRNKKGRMKFFKTCILLISKTTISSPHPSLSEEREGEGQNYGLVYFYVVELLVNYLN